VTPAWLLLSAGISELVDPLCKMAVKLHISVSAASDRFLAQQRRRNYTTPTSYLELIRLYVGMLGQQRDIVTTRARRYKTGLQKLYETNQVCVRARCAAWLGCLRLGRAALLCAADDRADADTDAVAVLCVCVRTSGGHRAAGEADEAAARARQGCRGHGGAARGARA
jgi:hypothetical protein